MLAQVSQHPVNFSRHAVWEHDDLSSPLTSPIRSSFSSSNVQLPRQLDRPPHREVSRDQIAAVAPELVDVPAEYIRKGLCAKTPQMYAGISALSPSHLPTSIPKSHLRHASPVTIPVRSPPSQNQPTYPTHLLAITCNSKSQTGTSDHVPLIATHSLVLAAHCASLPRMPYSYTQVRNGAVTIPVIPLSVPSPAAFQTLHQYLYSHNIAQLLSTLIPSIPPQFLSTLSSQSIRSTLGTGSKLHQLSAHCFSQTRAEGGHPTQILMGQAQHINALWRNAVALGCSDNDLWDVIDLAWEVILGSLNLAAGVH